MCVCVCVCVCVVGAVNDGKCSLRWSATVSVVQESIWWKGNQIRDNTSNCTCTASGIICKIAQPSNVKWHIL